MLVKLGEQVEILCDVDSHPTPSILWTQNGSFVYSFPKLLIHSIRSESYGEYKCTASLQEFPKISTTVKLVPPGALN
jgi:hypothetical protein